MPASRGPHCSAPRPSPGSSVKKSPGDSRETGQAPGPRVPETRGHPTPGAHAPHQGTPLSFPLGRLLPQGHVAQGRGSHPRPHPSLSPALSLVIFQALLCPPAPQSEAHHFFSPLPFTRTSGPEESAPLLPALISSPLPFLAPLGRSPTTARPLPRALTSCSATSRTWKRTWRICAPRTRTSPAASTARGSGTRWTTTWCACASARGTRT